MWGILNTLSNSEVEEVTIDSAANWKAAKILGPGIKVRICIFCNDFNPNKLLTLFGVPQESNLGPPFISFFFNDDRT